MTRKVYRAIMYPAIPAGSSHSVNPMTGVSGFNVCATAIVAIAETNHIVIVHAVPIVAAIINAIYLFMIYAERQA